MRDADCWRVEEVGGAGGARRERRRASAPVDYTAAARRCGACSASSSWVPTLLGLCRFLFFFVFFLVRFRFRFGLFDGFIDPERTSGRIPAGNKQTANNKTGTTCR